MRPLCRQGLTTTARPRAPSVRRSMWPRGKITGFRLMQAHQTTWKSSSNRFIPHPPSLVAPTLSGRTHTLLSMQVLMTECIRIQLQRSVRAYRKLQGLKLIAQFRSNLSATNAASIAIRVRNSQLLLSVGLNTRQLLCLIC